MARPVGYDRNNVVNAVERQFRRTGYAGTSLDDISAVTGLGRGSLYGGFGDKHDMFLVALEGYCSRTADEVATMLSGPDDEALDRLDEFVTSAARNVIDDPDGLGCMAGRFALELEPGLDERVTALINGVFRRLQSSLTECVAAAQRHGDLDPDLPPGEIALLIVALSRGFDVVARAGVKPKTLDEAADLAMRMLPLTKKGKTKRARRSGI
jgi:AcrR family transcriptional regulator